MKSKHTPGPWHIGYGNGVTGPSAPAICGATCGEDEGNETSEIVTVSDESEGRSSCVAILPVRSGKREQKANAALIAAAPDLLKACKAVLASSCFGEIKPCNWYGQLQRAVDKAEGKPTKGGDSK